MAVISSKCRDRCPFNELRPPLANRKKLPPRQSQFQKSQNPIRGSDDRLGIDVVSDSTRIGIVELAVDCRQGFKYKFLAASGDAAMVYKVILKPYKLRRIGL